MAYIYPSPHSLDITKTKKQHPSMLIRKTFFSTGE
jgi:hypothetical protein